MSQRTLKARTRPKTVSNGSVAGCTIIARNYLSHALILGRSYLKHMPSSSFYVLAIDGLPKGVSLPAGFELINLQELGLTELFEMSFKYDVTELATAVKPTLLRLLFEQYGESQAVYLDPDVVVFRPMTELESALQGAYIVLTPHTMTPIPMDDKRPSEQDILIAGAYNLGFIGLRDSDVTRQFLAWWAQRLRDLCRVDTSGGLMVDQRWIDLVPSLFDGVSLLKDETYNVAYWNLHSRQIMGNTDEVRVNGKPLTFFHFSGFTPRAPTVLSKHQSRTSLEAGSAIADLFNLYCHLHEENGYWESSQWPYGLAQFDNGVVLDQWMRQLYLQLPEKDRGQFGNPFSSRHPGSFFAWATQPADRDTELSPFLAQIYSRRYDVAAAFPEPNGADRERLLEWATTQGAFEMGYDWRLADFEEAARLARTDRVSRHPSGLPPGVNVCGYLSDESGLGTAARGYVRALRAAGVPVALRDVSALSVNRSGAVEFSPDAEHPHDVNLVCINADQHFVVMSQDPAFFQGRYNIAVWAWELSRFPREWYNRFRYYDEIWVGSSFVANALASVSPIPVVRIPPPLPIAANASRQRGRRRMGATHGETVFLFMFDFHSYIERKNPLAVLKAFQEAFTPTDRARLVFKCVNSKADKKALKELEDRIGGSRVSILSEYLSRDEIADLVAGCDCYVSLHRAEGTGLTIMEAMAAGKPVIATDWSGNTDFADSTNSYPVAYRIVELDHDIGPYRKGEAWAEPSISHAAELMRFVHEHPREAATRGRAAIGSMKAYSPEAVAVDIAARLRTIQQRRRSLGMPVRELPAAHSGNGPILNPIREVIDEHVPMDGTVLVISRGDEALLDLRGRNGWHFPQTDDGVYAGFYPEKSETAIAHLEALRARGAEYLLVPQTSAWWLHHYLDFRKHLDEKYELVRTDAACVLYRLMPKGITESHEVYTDGNRPESQSHAPRPHSSGNGKEPTKATLSEMGTTDKFAHRGDGLGMWGHQDTEPPPANGGRHPLAGIRSILSRLIATSGTANRKGGLK